MHSMYLSLSCLCVGASVSGHDESTGHHSPADAADPSAAGPLASAAPGTSTATASSHAAAGMHVYSKYEAILPNYLNVTHNSGYV